MNPGDYTFLFVIGVYLAFCDAFGIGANDVANSFATSRFRFHYTYSSLNRTLFLGIWRCFPPRRRHYRDHQGGIVQPSMYQDSPELLMVSIMFSYFDFVCELHSALRCLHFFSCPFLQFDHGLCLDRLCFLGSVFCLPRISPFPPLTPLSAPSLVLASLPLNATMFSGTVSPR